MTLTPPRTRTRVPDFTSVATKSESLYSGGFSLEIWTNMVPDLSSLVTKRCNGSGKVRSWNKLETTVSERAILQGKPECHGAGRISIQERRVLVRWHGAPDLWLLENEHRLQYHWITVFHYSWQLP